MNALTLQPKLVATLDPSELQPLIHIPPPQDGLLLAACYLLGFLSGAILATLFPLSY